MSGTASRLPDVTKITQSCNSVKNWTHEKFHVAEQFKQLLYELSINAIKKVIFLILCPK